MPEVYLGRIQHASRTCWCASTRFRARASSGEIYAIEPSVDEQTRTVLLRARVPNPGARLKPGMFARVALVLETRENAIIVPEQALVPQGDGPLRVPRTPTARRC